MRRKFEKCALVGHGKSHARGTRKGENHNCRWFKRGYIEERIGSERIN